MHKKLRPFSVLLLKTQKKEKNTESHFDIKIYNFFYGSLNFQHVNLVVREF